jgi:hypothetical protein
MQLFERPGVRWGVIFGAAAAVLGIIDGVVYAATAGSLITGSSGTLSGGALANAGLTCLFFLVDLALFFVAGMLTARQTGTVGSAAISGLIAGAIGGLIGGVANAVVVITHPDLLNMPSLSQSGIDVHSLVVPAAIFGVVLRAAFFGGLGAGLGALGGLAGRGNAPRQQAMAGLYGPPPGSYPLPGTYPPPGGMYPPPGTYPPPGYAPPTDYPAQPMYPPPPGYPPQPVYPPPPGYPPQPAYPPPGGYSQAPSYPPPPPAESPPVAPPPDESGERQG